MSIDVFDDGSAVVMDCARSIRREIGPHSMRLTDQSLDQLQTIFGDEFVREHHSEPTDRHLPQSGVYGVLRSLVESVRNGVLKALARLAASRGRSCFPHSRA